MRYDLHVHVAQLHRHAATDRFVLGNGNLYMRMFLRGLGLSGRSLRQPEANRTIREKLLDWAARSSIDRFVLLAMDGVYDEAGRPDVARTKWLVDNDFVADLAAASEAFLAGASIHPYRKDALDELRRLAARGACLVKWIPSAQGIRLDDPRSMAFYELLAAEGLPLLVHTGNEHTCRPGRNAWNHPALLRHALERGVTVIAAHCGARMFLHERCYFETFCRMARRYERLYGDLAAFGIPTRIGPLRRLQRDEELMAKIVYGSDFPALPMTRWFLFSIGASAVREIRAEPNPLERPYRLMRAMGVPEEVFTRAGRLLRLPQPYEGPTGTVPFGPPEEPS